MPEYGTVFIIVPTSLDNPSTALTQTSQIISNTAFMKSSIYKIS